MKRFWPFLLILAWAAAAQEVARITRVTVYQPVYMVADLVDTNGAIVGQTNWFLSNDVIAVWTAPGTN